MIRNGFSLVEILIVVAIVAVVAALLGPAFLSAKKQSKSAASLSNIRQCGMALLMYSDEYGSGFQNLPPNMAAAQVALLKSPTCDPLDYWRSSCAEQSVSPLVGSYAYVRLVSSWTDDLEWERFVTRYPNPTLLASIFYSSNRIKKFSGDVPPKPGWGRIERPYDFPDRVIRLRLDGSAKVTKHAPIGAGGVHHIMTWPAVFVASSTIGEN